MAIIPWTIKKQISYLAVIVIIVVMVIVIIIAKIIAPTCSDGKQNQEEQGIDCGGPCPKQCLGEVKDLIILWNKFFDIGQGKYDVVALIENPNLFLALPSFKYRFKLYDKNNIMITSTEDETFINPGETYPIFETGITIGNRTPQKAFIELEENPQWELFEKNEQQLVVSKKQFFNILPFPRLIVSVSNKSTAEIKNIYTAAILYDKDKNAIGASASKIESILGDASQDIVFTWPKPLPEDPSLIEVFFRTNLFH